MQKCVFLQSVWPCTHSGFTHNNVTVCAPARAAPEAVLSRFCLLDVSILNIWWFLALHLNLCMCVNFEEETNILFYFDFFSSFLLACLNWFENNHWNTSVYHLREVNIQLVLLFFFLFFWRCLFRWTDLCDRYLFIVQMQWMHLKLLSSVQPSATIWPPARLLEPKNITSAFVFEILFFFITLLYIVI